MKTTLSLATLTKVNNASQLLLPGDDDGGGVRGTTKLLLRIFIKKTHPSYFLAPKTVKWIEIRANMGWRETFNFGF